MRFRGSTLSEWRADIREFGWRRMWQELWTQWLWEHSKAGRRNAREIQEDLHQGRLR